MFALRLVQAAFFFVPLAIHGQVVSVTVKEEGTERNLSGAIVSLVGGADTAILARFTNEAGSATLRAPTHGNYRVLARRIGYRPGRASIAVPDEGTVEVVLRLRPSPSIVSTVVIKGDSSCGDIRTEGADVFLLWEHVRSALEANRLTETQRMVRMEIETYDRDLDRQLRERSKRLGRKIADTKQPFAAASPADLESRGYVRTINGETTYFAPDARTLLSEEFARSHCFYTKRGVREEVNLVGLAFWPKREISKPNISGVLWLDSGTFAMRQLVFQYVNVPSPVRLEGVGGRLEFEQLPWGAWIVPRWYIRTPRLGRLTRPISELSRTHTVDTLLGIRETGGTARVLADGELAGKRAGDDVASDAAADMNKIGVGMAGGGCSVQRSSAGSNMVFGAVTDAAGNAVPQAKLSLYWIVPELKRVGTSVVAGARGQFLEIEPDDRGNYAVCGLPTAVDYQVELIIAGGRFETQHVPAQRSAQRIELNFTVAPPSPAKPQRTAALVGTVTVEGDRGAPISDAEVIVSTLSTRTDDRGRFRLHGIPRGSHTVRIRRVGYAENISTADFVQDSVVSFFGLRPSSPLLEPVRVEASRGMQGFHERRKYGLGSFIGREQLDPQRSRQLGEVLGDVVGLRVVRLSGGDAAVATGRGNVGLSGRSKGGDATDRSRGAPAACYSQVFVDGIRVFAPNPRESLFNVNIFEPDGIEGIEYYRSPAETPAQYSSPAAECGTLLIWTRRGQPRDQK